MAVFEMIPVYIMYKAILEATDSLTSLVPNVHTIFSHKIVIKNENLEGKYCTLIFPLLVMISNSQHWSRNLFALTGHLVITYIRIN